MTAPATPPREGEKQKKRDYSGLLCVVMIIVIVYVIVQDYLYYKNEDPFMVTNIGDLEKLSSMSKYDGSKLYDMYQDLNEKDKVFVDDYIAHAMLCHKSRRPSFKKRYNGFVKQIFVTSVISVLVFSSSFGKQMKQNTFNYFISNLL